MENFFFGSPALDLIMIAAGFGLTMLLHFGVKERFWANFMLVVFTVECVVLIVSNESTMVKIFAAFLLGSVLSVRVLTRIRGYRAIGG